MAEASAADLMTLDQPHLILVPDPEDMPQVASLVLDPIETRVLGLWGVSKAGKNSVADVLIDQGWAHVSVGLDIMDFVLEGEDLKHLVPGNQETYDSIKRDRPDLHRKLVTYGNAVRRVAGHDVWAGRMTVRIEQLLLERKPVVWSNVRTHSDYMALRAVGGNLVRVHRPGVEQAFSELDLEIANNERYTAHYHFDNSGELGDIPAKVGTMLEALYGPRSS